MDALLALRRWLMRLVGVCAGLAALAILVSSLSITYGVFMRNVFLRSTTWELEGAVYAVILATFYAAAYTHASGGQVAIEILHQALPPRWRRLQRLLLDLLAALFFGFVAWSAWGEAFNAFTEGWRSDTMWGPPLWPVYSALPLGCGLLTVLLLIDVALRAAGTEPPEPGRRAGR